MKVAGLFAGIGGIERGLELAGGFETELLCENWDPARAVLSDRFGVDEADIAADVADLISLPAAVDLVTAGFPCTDLSQAGRTAGIGGRASGLVGHVFRLLNDASNRGRPPTWLVIENVANMLALDRGGAMRLLTSELEALGMKWAYRVVDSRFTGVPQRRRRVILVASAVAEPADVLFRTDAGELDEAALSDEAFGFYWTEGRTGLGWAHDAVPTLKGGSTLGIPSPPAVWVPNADLDRRFVKPLIEDAEALQGFPRGWTENAATTRSNGPRWKLVGNAVTVGVSKWLGEQLSSDGQRSFDASEWNGDRSWPTAAFGGEGAVMKVAIGEFPEKAPYSHLLDVIDPTEAAPLSWRAANGFWLRLSSSNLGRHTGFREDMEEYVEMAAATSLLAAS